MSERKKPSLIQKLFGNRNEEVDILLEEQIQSPSKMMLDNFLHNRLGMTGLIGFFVILMIVSIIPLFVPINLGESDNTQTNTPPGLSMMAFPKELEGHVADISNGPTFGAGVDTDGKVYTWGHTKITKVIDVANVPMEVQRAKIVMLSCGYDHITAVDEDNNVYVWGNTRLGQDNVPSELVPSRTRGTKEIVQLETGYQISGAVTADGEAYLWGNENMSDLSVHSEYQGHIKKIAITNSYYCLLLDNGSVVYGGVKNNAFSNVPSTLKSHVVDIAASSDTMCGLKDDGTLIFWGNGTHGENNAPELSSKPVEIYGGRWHYSALLENGDVVSWGNNSHGETKVPDAVNNAQIDTIFSGYFQNYAVTKEGKILTWGLKGYTLGTDNLGRDILTRLVHGGKTTMTVGFIAEVIALLIGIIAGGLAGYFGGTVDLLIMRVAEVIGSLPFLPFALLLSAIIGSTIDVQLRMYLIMVVLGLLSWTGICRLVRAQILAEREKEFVLAAQAMGVKEGSIIFKHILPNVLSILLVEATLGFATCMLTESSLSYLGFGISPPTPTWGNMLNGANNSIVIQQYWWQWVFVSFIFGICTICINLVGDAVRDAVDPKSLGR
ncbi:MAG: ABC transporter permease subunit [Erysipelotrichaceae bacterium]|nr:ABC transporter permease subunit [Erysipelotrichaceae bacterium]